ncbi:DNA-processing protein DprA [Cohnella rhizosphaerae]|uniref:DNA-protecting protein DprA n=1 Tax=Cohnella rhizosphaerae TaxID=1457232 RepID=A0A9X4KWF2_9BACL|nr:DNA-processing protein DprA [Cohnella rhizosphaerae]MDG0812415.1 DNA-protecting protein DprA [Cohnella rhizosphaerae]
MKSGKGVSGLLDQMRDTLAALHETEGVGWETINTILAKDGLKDAALRRPGEWRELGLSARRAEAIVASLDSRRMERRRARWEKTGLSIVTEMDPDYPELLRHIYRPPWVLYYIGRLELLARPQVAVVGTRQATIYGKRAAETLSDAFSHAGLAVTSGMAKGIDAAAHAGALRGAGGTVAVLGSPADVVYPPENRMLYRRIAEEGLIVSMTPPDVPIHPGMFPMRNRIIAGLSLGGRRRGSGIAQRGLAHGERSDQGKSRRFCGARSDQFASQPRHARTAARRSGCPSA